MELRYYYALGTIDNKGAFLSHIGNPAQVYILDLCCEILMLGVGTRQLQFGLRGTLYEYPRSRHSAIV